MCPARALTIRPPVRHTAVDIAICTDCGHQGVVSGRGPVCSGTSRPKSLTSLWQILRRRPCHQPSSSSRHVHRVDHANGPRETVPRVPSVVDRPQSMDVAPEPPCKITPVRFANRSPPTAPIPPGTGVSRTHHSHPWVPARCMWRGPRHFSKELPVRAFVLLVSPALPGWTQTALRPPRRRAARLAPAPIRPPLPP